MQRSRRPGFWRWAARSSMPRSSPHRSSATPIKEGRIPAEWAKRPAKLRQKDRDARWTVKYTKAKPSEDGAPRVDLAVPAFGYKNHIGIDRRKSAVRAAVEHVFARQKGPMGLYIRTIGIARARTKIGLANLVYNMKRMVWLTAQVAPA